MGAAYIDLTYSLLQDTLEKENNNIFHFQFYLLSRKKDTPALPLGCGRSSLQPSNPTQAQKPTTLRTSQLM